MYNNQIQTAMTTNLIDVLRKSFTEESYRNISDYVGINPESTKNGIHAIIPAVLVSILGNNTVNNATQPTWWNALKDDYHYTENEFIDTNNVKAPSFIIKGREMLAGMFRTCHDDLVLSVSSIAGVQKKKAAGLIEISVPLIMGYLNNWMRRNEWKFKDLIKNLFEQKATIVGALPVGISPAHFGVSNLPKNNFSETIETKIPTQGIPRKKRRNGLMWLIGLIVLGVLLWYFLG